MKTIWFYLTITLLTLFHVKGEIPVFVYDNTNHRIDGEYIGILEDVEGELTIEQVIQQDDFKVGNQKIPNLMISKSVHWAKINIKNISDEDLLLEYAYPIIDQADLYIVSPDGSITLQRSGELVPITHRKYKHPNFIYDLEIPKNQTRTIFFKIKNGQQVMLPLEIGSKEVIFNSMMENNIYSAIYLGIILVMFLYNLIIFFTTRDKNYLFYVGYIIAAGLTHISHHGYTYKLLWPSQPWLAEWSVALSPSLVGFAGILFIRHFLRTKYYVPRIHRFFNFLMLAYIVCASLYFAGLSQISYQLSQTTALILALTIFVAAIPIVRKGYRPAKFFIIAWTVFLSSVVIFILKDFGILPYNMLTVYCLEIGASIELVMLSFALADKINIMRKEKEVSQAKTLEALKENERIIREQNIILEGKVKERTHELERTNSDLSTALTDLKETQSQLVDAEKMASLGQLTAGIAHEINNPINFVVSNINPLKRDIQDLMEVLSKYAEITDQSDISEKLQEINELKEYIELDFVVEEIDNLLKGMDDGANRTAEIVKSLRTFSRLDETDLKQADINEGLDSTLLLLNNSFSDRIEIIKEYDNLNPIDCYAGKVNQLFMNIIKNAAQAIDEKQYDAQEKPTITLTTKNDNDNIRISIKDNGTGMDEATMSRIFEPFFTTKDVGEGTGLGLSIAYNIIEKHNGTIRVESEPGVGTEFIMTIPRQQASSEDAENRMVSTETMKQERRNRLVENHKPIKNTNYGDF